MKNIQIFSLLLISFCSLPYMAKAQDLPVAMTDTANNKITITGTTILYNGSMVGHFKKTLIDNDLTLIVVYNNKKARVAETTHATCEKHWTIITPVDQNKMYIPYTAASALQDLFLFLVEKGYL